MKSWVKVVDGEMWSNLRYILQEETTGFAAGLVIEDNGKEGIKDGSQASGLKTFGPRERWTDLGG